MVFMSNMTFNFDTLTEPAPKSSLLRSNQRVREAEPHARRRALLVGQPNVGKSVVFGALTGRYVTVSNYPGTTVEVTRGRADLGSELWEIVDTPGTHNLVPMSEDEAVTRDLLVTESHDAVVQVGDAKNLARTLLLTLQLAELGIPFCLDLNMLDEARARGLAIDMAQLENELPGVKVNASTATLGQGIDEIRNYLARRGEVSEPAAHAPLACAPSFPNDVEAAVAAVQHHLGGTLPIASRAVATMLLAGHHHAADKLATLVGPEAVRVAAERSADLERAHGVPAFALLSRLRLARAQAIVRRVQRRTDAPDSQRNAGGVGWPRSLAVSGAASLIAALVYDGALARTRVVSRQTDPLGDYGVIPVVSRLFSRDLFAHWSIAGIVLLALVAALGSVLVRKHARAAAAGFKLAVAFAAGWTGYFAASFVESFAMHRTSSVPVHFGAAVGVLALAFGAYAGDAYDARSSQAVGRLATHRVWGVGLLAVVLLLAYKVVGAFGAGTAVDFVENGVFGSVAAQAALDAPSAPEALGSLGAAQPPPQSAPPEDNAADGTQRLLVVRHGPERVAVFAQTKQNGRYEAMPARIDVYAAKARVTAIDGGVAVEGDLRRAEARIWTGYLNRWAYGFFAWIGVPLLTAFFVGPYGLITMGVTYAVAIVLPVVATFFFVFSLLEDSGYLPRLAVMANRGLRGMGLNGKAVLPMVLGLGCDTMATLTARIMETRKERVLVTLLLALGIPCSSQLSVIFALMQRTSLAATLVWLAVVVATLLGVGWVAARVLPGDTSDFLLEMPPIRQPMLMNLVRKTMARIEWYLKEAVPLFLLGTALLFALDALHLLGVVHRIGEPVVHHVLGFPRAGGISDRISEDLLVGFLRRDFGAAGMLDLARSGRLSPADIAVSMVTITLFIPCIANVFMMAKERGYKVAGAMTAFIFPYAVAVGAAVRFGFRLFGGS
jgi:Fe2+ transport system protein B